MNRTFTFEDSQVDGAEFEVEVEYSYCKGYVGSTDGRFGPKLEPDEPAHFEIDSVTRDGEPFDLTTEQEDHVLETLADIESEDSRDWDDGFGEADDGRFDC